MRAHGTAIYADEVSRFSTAMVRAALGLRRQRGNARVVSIGGHGAPTVEVRLVEVETKSPAVPTVTRIECPNCRRPARVVGFHPGRAGWGCRRCFHWHCRSAKQRTDAIRAALKAEEREYD